MTIKEIFSVLAGFLCFIGYIPYVNAILRKGASPARATWLIWAFLDVITLAGMYAQHSVNGLILVASLGALTVGILSLKYGKPGWTNIDTWSIGGAFAGIILWGTFDSPTLGIVISLAVIFLGSIPTFMSAWEDPSRENKTAWIIFFFSCICAVAAIPRWTLAAAAQPIIFFVIELIMIFILFGRSQTSQTQGNEKVLAQ